MIVQKADIFKGISERAMSEIAEITIEQSHEKGSQLYTPEQAANHFYILIEGAVRLTMGKDPEIHYTVAKEGEVFGWSSVVDRESYTTRAECLASTRLVKIDRSDLNRILFKYPTDGLTFFKRLANAVVQRLVDNYHACVPELVPKGLTSTSVELVALAFS